MDDDASLPPLNVPGFPTVTAFGAGSREGWHYTPELGQAIADLYADSEGGGLWDCHHMAPDRVPPPGIVRAWCRQFPAFGLAIKDAERLRAEKFMEQTVVLADSGEGSIPRLALRIATRQTMAEKLDPRRYGKAGGDTPLQPQLGRETQPTAIELDDDTLAALAMAGQASSEAAG